MKAASEIYAPVPGTVSEVNSTLEDKPGLVNSQPLGEGEILLSLLIFKFISFIVSLILQVNSCLLNTDIKTMHIHCGQHPCVENEFIGGCFLAVDVQEMYS